MAALAYAQGAVGSASLILAPDEGVRIGSHHIKADPQTGSRRLGAGLQRVKGGQGIPVHRHEQEDEILFVHSGSGVGAVGDERKNIDAGTTLYIPQGTWHGIESRSDMQVLWVVSPPHFAENLRAIAAKVSGGGSASSSELESIGRKHGFRDSREFFLPRLATIAAILGIGAALVTLVVRLHPFQATLLYALGAVVATTITISSFGPGQLPAIAFVAGALMISVAVLAGACGGTGIHFVARRAVRHLNRKGTHAVHGRNPDASPPQEPHG